MPAALAVGGHGRKGSLPVKACEAGCWGCTCALFLCELFRVDYIFGAADNVLVYTTLLIISVRRPVFLERFRITIEYTKKRHDCIIDFHVKVIFNTQRRFFLYSSDKAILD